MAGAIRADVASAPNPATKLQVLNRYFFSALGFRPVRAETPEAFLPIPVLGNKQGNCLGLSIIYLALARDLDLPLSGVAAPNHLFLRYSSRDFHLNLELLEQGLRHDDGYYLKEYRIPASSIRRGIFMRSLSDREVLGHLYLSLGAYYSKAGDYSSSFALYRAAARDAPDAPTAHLNLGQDFLARNRPEEALREFTSALKLYPGNTSALAGRSKAHCRLGHLRKAKKDLETILKTSPESPGVSEALARMECDGSDSH